MDNQRLLRSIVKLTETPDVRAFERSLIVTLDEIISATAIRLYKIHDNPEVPGQKLAIHIDPSDEEALGHGSGAAVPLDGDRDFTACLATEQRTAVCIGDGAGVRVIHPIRAAGGIIGFLVVEAATDNPGDQELVAILLGFYKNYVSLLNDSQHDKLTGLFNRKTFDDKVLRIIASQRSSLARASDGHGGYCLAILDIDFFKRVNDKFGHLYGDEVLLLYTQIMAEAFRDGDLLFRIGGEEFVAVLKDVDLERAMAVFERFRQTIEAHSFPQVGTITTSVGATLITAEDLPATAIDRADKALYYAKNNGRNQVRAYEELLAQGMLKAAKDKSDVELF